MKAATRGRNAFRQGVRPVVVHVLIFLAAMLGSSLPTSGQDVAPPKAGEEQPIDGVFITVPNPLDSAGVKRVIAQTNRFLDRADQRGLKIVYDFNPDNSVSRTGDYGVCRDLAQYLLQHRNVTTIALVHNDVTEHTVLPVLACQEIVMSKNARLGDALGDSRPGGDKVHRLDDDQFIFYERVARSYSSPAIVLKMVDKDIEVVEGTRGGGVVFIDKRQEAEENKKGFVAAAVRDPVLRPGQTARYDVAQALKFGLATKQLDTRKEVKDAYRLPTSSLREDPLQGRSPDAWRMRIGGELTRASREKIERGIRRAVSKGGNLIFLELECGGTDTGVARDLADALRNLKDDKGGHGVMTVAYVTERARDCATFIAFGCTEIVMDQKARLGDFENVLKKRPNDDWAISKSLADLAEKQGYSPLLARGMLERNIAIHLAMRRDKTRERRLMEAEEVDAAKNGEWDPGELIKPAGELLKLDGPLARKLDVAKFVFEGNANESLAWLADRYGLAKDKIEVIPSDWLGDLADFLCHPVVSVFLVMIGIIGLILELKVPGVGLPGVIAAICFVLYFWAHSQLAGHLTMLAILLFILGLILIGLEIFLVPGLGITGISGIVLLVVSLGLVTLVKKPETSSEWIEFGKTLTTLTFGLLAAVGGAFAIAYYLPHIPWANRMVLSAPGEHGSLLEDESASSEGYGSLLGAIGEAATTLRPAGKARFGEEFVDVVAEGSYVLAGARVQVIEIEGNRIVVKEV
jgi:membrane-bound ClpP family serine protease